MSPLAACVSAHCSSTKSMADALYPSSVPTGEEAVTALLPSPSQTTFP